MSIFHGIYCYYCILLLTYHNTLRQAQNGCHFADSIFKLISLNENFCILIQISMKFLPNGPTDNTPALFQIMAWCLTCDKPLSEAIDVLVYWHIYELLCLTELNHTFFENLINSPLSIWYDVIYNNISYIIKMMMQQQYLDQKKISSQKISHTISPSMASYGASIAQTLHPILTLWPYVSINITESLDYAMLLNSNNKN